MRSSRRRTPSPRGSCPSCEPLRPLAAGEERAPSRECRTRRSRATRAWCSALISGPSSRALVERVADVDVLRALRDAVDDRRTSGSSTRSREPAVQRSPLREKICESDRVERAFEVGSRRRPRPATSAELQRAALQRRRAAAMIVEPGRRLACERRGGRRRDGDERVAGDLAAAVHDVHDAGREAGLSRRAPRRSAVSGATPRASAPPCCRREAGAMLPGREHQRQVPRHDQPGDADRLVDRVVQELVAHLIGAPGSSVTTPAK